jgi:tRNA pseudouridine55 synthase
MSKPRRPKRKVNGILLLDKPAGYSSNQALQQARRLYQAEKAGHTGSLDPLATGLLPICFGQATKLCGYLLDSDKRYVATARLGEKTNTGDAEGQVIARSDASSLSRAALEAVVPQFLGEIQQVPPMYSALKREGQRLYELARQGLEVDREPRVVTIHALELLDFAPEKIVVDVRCSKGTYIRTLIEDWTAATGHLAHLTALRRLEVAPFNQPRMITAGELETASNQGFEALDEILVPLVEAFSHWQKVQVDADRAHYLSRGQAVRVAGSPINGSVAVLDPAGTLLCIGEMDNDGLVAPKRWLTDSFQSP